MATVAEFLVSYPEFSAAETEAPGLIAQKLTDATARTNATVMGGVAEQAIKLRAAIELMRSPWARALRLESPDAITTWQDALRDMQVSATSCMRIFP
jgi:hypothetical protein